MASVIHSILPDRLRGILTLTAIFFSTCIGFPLVLIMAFCKLAVPIDAFRKWCTEVLIGIAERWIGFNNFLLETMHKIEFEVVGVEGLSRKEWYLVTCNHQSWADIPVVQKVLSGETPMLKFFLKQQLIWVPLIGVAWWALDFPFMKRYTKEEIAKNPSLQGKDLETTRKACEKFKYTPVAVFNFAEGTRFTPKKHALQASPYSYLLKPKAGGAAFVLGAMGKRMKTLLNITLHYPGGNSGFWDFMCGKIKHVRVVVEKKDIPEQFLGRDYQSDEDFRTAFQEWLGNLWHQKDALLKKLHAHPTKPLSDITEKKTEKRPVTKVTSHMK